MQCQFKDLYLYLIAKLCNLSFHSLEVVSRYRDPQLQVVDNYSYLFSLGPNTYSSYGLNINLSHKICHLT